LGLGSDFLTIFRSELDGVVWELLIKIGPMSAVHIVGIGLDGPAGLTKPVRLLLEMATFLVGSESHLSYFAEHPAQRLILVEINDAIRVIRSLLSNEPALEKIEVEPPQELIVVFVSGDPLFFDLGRLFCLELPAQKLTFHPHLSCVQLAFNRIKVPWQNVRTINASVREMPVLQEALRGKEEKIAVLVDHNFGPQAIARLVLSLDLPWVYEFWVCENLGGNKERVRSWLMSDKEAVADLLGQTFEQLSVVVLLRRPGVSPSLDVSKLPVLGLADSTFGMEGNNLETEGSKGVANGARPLPREVRVLVLLELAPSPHQVIWNVGAGTGDLAIEVARLSPSSQVYAIEKKAAATVLIEENCRRLKVSNVVSINGSAPEILYRLPAPDRIFIAGIPGLRPILGVCGAQLKAGGVLVMASETVEELNDALIWVNERSRRLPSWSYRLLQVNLSRSVPVAGQTRYLPLNPVTILTAMQGSIP
jgi:precorrin-6B C5,15-methyltransferase / cobalt-precorrin-6B C5,C15-methyltransferase